ncbi:hypothetical protein [Streptomyces griseoloalbus]|uniref:Uncharacterized protein n=1 Tax=Streptomyces griseoloalbus TaxID=67303 RepID=A0A7W8F7E2_9ACTN|nr:hypothetical protein [Streptomyces albaduncus]MBB5124877.1 hypothetical protein [Streptomyces albaduncus]GGW72340.1 hypothetical protein GCM10010340_58380 [Streptomyces albaduncus]
MAVLPGHPLELWLSPGLATVLVGLGVVRQRRPGTRGDGAIPAARSGDTERTPERTPERVDRRP